jgi:hypothetical protein
MICTTVNPANFLLDYEAAGRRMESDFRRKVMQTLAPIFFHLAQTGVVFELVSARQRQGAVILHLG